MLLQVVASAPLVAPSRGEDWEGRLFHPEAARVEAAGPESIRSLTSRDVLDEARRRLARLGFRWE